MCHNFGDTKSATLNTIDTEIKILISYLQNYKSESESKIRGEVSV